MNTVPTQLPFNPYTHTPGRQSAPDAGEYAYVYAGIVMPQYGQPICPDAYPEGY